MFRLLEMDPNLHTRLLFLTSLTQKGLQDTEENRQLTLRGISLRNLQITFDALIVGQDLDSAETALRMNGMVGRLTIPIITSPDLTRLVIRPVQNIQLGQIGHQIPQGMEPEEFMYQENKFHDQMWTLGMTAAAAIMAQFSQFPPGSTLLVVCHRARIDAAMLHLRGLTELTDMERTPLLGRGHMAEMIVDHTHKEVLAFRHLTDEVLRLSALRDLPT